MKYRTIVAERGKWMDPWDVPTWTLLVVPLLLGLAAFMIGFALGSL